jgi:hypothetical protein
MIALDKIDRVIRDEGELPLNEETLGPELLGRVSRLLNTKPTDLRLCNCQPTDSDESHVRLSARMPSLFGFKNITTEFSLFERPSARTERVRHCVFSIEMPAGATVHSYLGQYVGEPDKDSPPRGTAVTPMLARYFRKIAFEGRMMVFSSIDYTQRENEDAFYPQVYRTHIPASQVKAGLNFLAKIAYSKEAASSFAELFETDNRVQALLETESPNQIVTVTPGEQGLSLNVDQGVGLELELGPISLSLEVIRVSLPLVTVEGSQPQVGLTGSLKLKLVERRLKMTAEFRPYYRDFSVSLWEFPSLKEVMGLLGQNAQDAYFPEPLSSLLSVKLSSFGMALNLAKKSVRGISLSLSTDEAIPIIENLIRFAPELDIGIDYPLDEQYRAIQGELRGIWQFGKTQFRTALYYPSFNFSAGMAEGQTLDFGAVLKHLLSGIDLAEPHLSFTTMEVYGNFLSKSFSAEIGVDDNSKCAFSIAGRPFGFQIKNMLMAYDNQRVSYAMDGSLVLADVEVFLSAQYVTDQGWMLSGSTAIGATINLSRIANDLLDAMALPAGLPDLELTDIAFSAAPKLGAYSLDGRTAKAWHLTEKLSLGVEQFAVVKRQGLSVTGLLRVTLKIGETVNVRLSAEKSAAAAGGWKFEGSSAEGQKIKITEIVNWVGQQFGNTPRLPEAIEGFTVDKLSLSFESESQDFFFTCGGEVTLPGQSSLVQGVITIDIKNQGKSFTKLFGGSLIIDGMKFDLVFESSRKTTGGETSTALVAAYHDPKGNEISIDALINKVVQTPLKTGLTLIIKDALFACQSQTSTSSQYLFGIDIEAGLNLSDLQLPDLPLIGASFPSDQNLKLTLQVLYASSDFSQDAVGKLNRLNSKGLSLPQQGMTEGLALAALLRVGQEVKSLNLPISNEQVFKGPDNSLPAPSTPSTLPGSHAAVSSANTPSADSTQWLKIQRTFGPIHIERVGVGYQDSQFQCLLDAGLTAAGLTLSLDGLGLEFSLSELTERRFKPTFHLDGIGIDYRNGPLEIGGAFLRQKLKNKEEGTEYTGYAGLAVIRTEKLSLSAIGSYAAPNGRDPSLFIYAVLNYPLGGPAFFFVTGFAAGFGYNRTLNIPGIDDIANFPLVEEANKGDAPPLTQETLTTELQKLADYIPPSLGDTFVAAGIKFTTFKQVDSFALLIVKFGQRFEIDLLGISTLLVPPAGSGTGNEPIAQAQLALKATFIPDEGLLSIQAQLTPNSYILSKACHLTGGFAFFSWFKDHSSGAKAGDFVITLGGYHPQFEIPKHYPIVPRLGFNWQVNKPDDHFELLIKGQAYFALTAQAIMAGGILEATWSSGALKAWFKASADFLITWQPYHYDASFYIDIGASYTFDLFGTHTITVDLGADLHLWGPEFSGTATLHLWIISFTVQFGSQAPPALEPIVWEVFKKSFLPKNDQQVCSISLQKGLIRQIKTGQEERWIVNPKELVLATSSVIPIKTVTPPGEYIELNIEAVDLANRAHQDLAVAPMGIVQGDGLSSTHTINITRDDGHPIGDPKSKEPVLQFVPVYKAVPAGLWGKPNLAKDKKHLSPPSLNGERLIENTLAGFEIRPANPCKAPDHTASINCALLQYETELIPEAYTWQEDFRLTDLQGKTAWDAASAATETTVANAERDNLLTALGWVDPDLDFGQPIKEGVLVTV